MARKNSNSGAVIGPDSDDLDGQGNSNGTETRTENAAGTGDGTGPVDPASIANGDDYRRDDSGNVIYSERTGKPLRKRGRKSGGTGARITAGNSSLKDSIEMLAQVINIAHVGLAVATKTPELELENKEAETLSKSIVNVLDQFDVKPDPRVTAFVGLITTAGTIYYPRYYLIKERRKTEKKSKVKDATDNVSFLGSVPAGSLNG